MRARTCTRKEPEKVLQKTGENSSKAWNCAQSPADGTEFLHGQGGTFYVSATKNIRLRNAKRTVRTAETYGSKKGTIQNNIIFNKKLFDPSTGPKSFLFKNIIFLEKYVHQSEILHLSTLFSKSNLQLDQTKMDD